MSLINNIRTGSRMFIAFGSIVFLMIAMACSVYIGIINLEKSLINALNTDARLSEFTSRCRANIHAMRQYEKDMIINLKDKDAVEKYYSEWKNEYKNGMEKINSMEKLLVCVLKNPQKQIIRYLSQKIIYGNSRGKLKK